MAVVRDLIVNPFINDSHKKMDFASVFFLFRYCFLTHCLVYYIWINVQSRTVEYLYPMDRGEWGEQNAGFKELQYSLPYAD